MTDQFLDRAYGLSDPEDTRDLYDDWAASYDAEVAENGYATPGRVAAALAAHVPDPGAPLLDYGCGTGLSGLALKLAGFGVIDGMDPSPGMLDGARAKNLYRALMLMDVADPTPVPRGIYPVIAAIGVIGAGAAPVATLDILLGALPPGGILGFSFNDHTLEDPQYEARLNAWTDPGTARLLSRDDGPHLPARNLGATVYVVEKA